MKVHHLFLLVVALTLSSVQAARSDTFVVIRNAKAPSQLSRSEVRALYTGKTRMFGDSVAVIVIPGDDGTAFDAFAEQVFGISTKTLLAKIKQEVFKGEMAKPLKAASDDEVVRHVAATAGAIGVIAAQAAKSLPTGVAVLGIGG